MTDLNNIEAGAIKVREAADALCKRIELFQEYLNKLSGRVETSCSQGDLTLHLHRKGKGWIVSYKNDFSPDGRPLLDAPLVVKMKAVGMFPDLLLSIEKSQELLVHQIDLCSQRFDEFWSGLDLKLISKATNTVIEREKTNEAH